MTADPHGDEQASAPPTDQDALLGRREALRRIAKFATYTAPALLVLLKSEKAFGASLPSDARLKRDVVRVGRLDNGLHLYRYRYLWSDQTFVGVMAQEVQVVDPRSVRDCPGGYLSVDYEGLGLRLRTWDEWTRV